MPSVVKMQLKGKFGGHVLNSHGNYIVDHGIVFLNFCGIPDMLNILNLSVLSFLVCFIEE